MKYDMASTDYMCCGRVISYGMKWIWAEAVMEGFTVKMTLRDGGVTFWKGNWGIKGQVTQRQSQEKSEVPTMATRKGGRQGWEGRVRSECGKFCLWGWGTSAFNHGLQRSWLRACILACVACFESSLDHTGTECFRKPLCSSGSSSLQWGKQSSLLYRVARRFHEFISIKCLEKCRHRVNACYYPLKH